ncbi:recombinase family protein [Clostridium sardiniense]|uniref:recombinase family protein n=1 Tax=Clostridium sardiniense TaxID=29369 RepID=UPI003D336E3F
MIVAIYSRKSKFTGKGDSIENQIEMCKEHIKTYISKDAEFIIYEDEGFSGGNINRPQFKNLMNDIKHKKIDLLICYRLDRISRNVSDFSSVLDTLQEYKVDFISIKEQFDTSSPMGRAMIYIASVFSQLERETIAERVKDNMLEMAKNGKWTGGRVPLGFRSNKTTTLDSEGKKRQQVTLVHDEKEIEFVKFLYEKYLELGSLHKLEVYTHENNIRSYSGKLFEKSTLKIILQNPIYVKANASVIEYLNSTNWTVYGTADNVHSLLTYNKTETITKNGKITKATKELSERLAAISSIKGYIEPGLWLKVQMQLDSNRDTFPRLGKTHNALLIGKLYCGKCGSRMLIQHGRVSKKTGEKLFYYVCSLKRTSRKTLCDNHNVNLSKIEAAVLKALKDLTFDKKSFLDNVRIEYKKSSDKSIELLTLNRSLEDKKQQIDILVDKLSHDDKNLLTDILFDKITLLKNECIDIETKIENLRKEKVKLENQALEFSLIETLLNKCAFIDKLSHGEQKQIINALIDSIYYYPNDDGGEKIKINFIGSIAEVNPMILSDEKRQLDKLSFYSHCMPSI